MAVAVVGGAAFVAAFAEFYDTVKNVASETRLFRLILKDLEITLDSLLPTVISEQLILPEVETKRLIEHMKKGGNLVRKCSKIPSWNYIFKVFYHLKLKQLEDEIVRFCQVDLFRVCDTRNGLRTLETLISKNKKVGSFRGVENMWAQIWKAVQMRKTVQMLCPGAKFKGTSISFFFCV